MALEKLIVKQGPNAATKQENTLQDWDNFLHGIWLEKIAASPGLYSDAKQTREVHKRG